MEKRDIGKLLAVGVVSGFFSAALGIGGGVIMVPALLFYLKYDIKEAVGVSLASIVPGAFVGVLTYFFMHSLNVDLRNVFFIVCGSVAGARAGVWLAGRVNAVVLRRMFAFILFFTGLKLAGVIDLPAGTVTDAGLPLFLVLLGGAAGLSSGLFGIGGGVIMVPVLNLFFGLSMHEAIGTSLAVIVPTSLAGAWFHKRAGNMKLDAVMFILPAVLAGAVSGALVSDKMPDAVLKFIFGVLLILCAVKLFRGREDIESRI
ncbi:MAG: sulfite exporter TauE/SafE family protein [Candidatus Omnitrophota bacterium]